MAVSGYSTVLGVVSSLGVESNTSNIDAAWLVRPDVAGVYSLELTLGTAHMRVQVKVCVKVSRCNKGRFNASKVECLAFNRSLTTDLNC